MKSKKKRENYTFGVAAKAIVFNEGKYLVLKKSEMEDIGANDYDFPGGRVEYGENPEETVVRETKEETGLSIKPLRIVNVWNFVKEKDNFQLVGVDFLSELQSGKEKFGDEHVQGEWLTAKEIQEKKDLPGWLVETIKKVEDLREELDS